MFEIEKTEEWCFYQAVWFVIVKNRNLLKSKKLADHFKNLIHLLKNVSVLGTIF